MATRVKRKNSRTEFDCVDCGVNTHNIHEYYMVNKPVWRKTKLGAYGGMLCIGCLEKRIKRKLTWQDFAPAPVNLVGVFFKQSRRLRNILKGSYLDTHPLPRAY